MHTQSHGWAVAVCAWAVLLGAVAGYGLEITSTEHAAAPTTLTPGGTVTISGAVEFTGWVAGTSLRYSIPEGWTYVNDSGAALGGTAQFQFSDAENVLVVTLAATPSSPLTFSFRLQLPDPITADGVLGAVLSPVLALPRGFSPERIAGNHPPVITLAGGGSEWFRYTEGGIPVLVDGDYRLSGAPVAGDYGSWLGPLVFHDANASGGWDPGELIWLDNDSDRLFSAASDAIVKGSPSEGSAGLALEGTFCYRDANYNGFYDAGELAWSDPGSDWQFADGSATVTDADTPANLAGGRLYADLLLGGTAADRLGIRNQGTGAGAIGVNGTTVTYGGAMVGTVTDGTGANGYLTVDFTAAATLEAAQALVRSIGFGNASDAPDPDVRTIRLLLTDGDALPNIRSYLHSVDIFQGKLRSAASGADFHYLHFGARTAATVRRVEVTCPGDTTPTFAMGDGAQFTRAEYDQGEATMQWSYDRYLETAAELAAFAGGGRFQIRVVCIDGTDYATDVCFTSTGKVDGGDLGPVNTYTNLTQPANNFALGSGAALTCEWSTAALDPNASGVWIMARRGGSGGGVDLQYPRSVSSSDPIALSQDGEWDIELLTLNGLSGASPDGVIYTVARFASQLYSGTVGTVRTLSGRITYNGTAQGNTEVRLYRWNGDESRWQDWDSLGEDGPLGRGLTAGGSSGHRYWDYSLKLPPGTYAVSAQIDLNGNHDQDRGEPVGRYPTADTPWPGGEIVITGANMVGKGFALSGIAEHGNGASHTLQAGRDVTVQPANDPPECTLPPAITGNLTPGSTLTATPGGWNDARDGNPPPTVYVVQWQRADAPDGTGLEGLPDTGSSHVVVRQDQGKYLRLQVTATDDGTPGTMSALAFSPWLQVPPEDADDFDDGLADPAKWGDDIVLGNAALTEVNGRLEYTSNDGPELSRARVWRLSYGSYMQDWEFLVEVNVGDVALTTDGQKVDVGMLVWNNGDRERDYIETELRVDRGAGTTRRAFLASVHVDDDWLAPETVSQPTAAQAAAIRITFEAATKTLKAWYSETTGGGAYNWQFLRQVDIDATGSSWGMTEAAAFTVVLNGSSDLFAVTPGQQVYFDNFRVGGVHPSVMDVTSGAPNGTYSVGAVIPVMVTFSEPVHVTGTPQLALETGVYDALVDCTSGSGTAVLIFPYTAVAGHTSADLDYLGTAALVLNGGTIRDAAGDNAALTLAAPGAAHSLGANRDIVIHTTHLVTFHTGGHGTRVGGGQMAQAVVPGSAAVAPTVQADEGWIFAGWDTDFACVTGDLIVSALFRQAGSVAPTGRFMAHVDATAVTSGRGLWNLSGAYTTTMAGNPLTLNLMHDTTGKLSGTATYTVAPAAVVTMPVKGSVRGASGSIAMKGALRGTDPPGTAAVSVKLNLTVDTANRQLVGHLTGTLRANGTTTPVNDDLTLVIPAPMDGAWTLQFDLDQSGRAVTGTAELTLSSLVKHTFVVSGRTGASNTAVLSLAGDPADPAARAVRIRTTIATLEGGWVRLESFSGKGYGQALGW